MFFLYNNNLRNYNFKNHIVFIIISVFISILFSLFIYFIEVTKYENFMCILLILFGLFHYKILLYCYLYFIAQSIIFLSCISENNYIYFFLQFYLLSLFFLCILYLIKMQSSIFITCMFLVQIINIFLLIYLFHIKTSLISDIKYNIIFLMDFYYFYYEMILQFNFLSLSICYVVLLIGTFVKIFSLAYLAKESLKKLFFLYLCIFEFFMVLISISGDFLLLFLGWEGVGVMSFSLISFWFTRTFAIFAGIKALLINKIGDFCLIISFVLIIYFYKTTSIVEFLILVTRNNNESAVFLKEIILFFFVLAACVKSAQFGAHTWLLDAMEGPTPVSALLHAATMVTAGIILLLKFYILFYCVVIVPYFCVIIGCITMLFGSICACFQYDIKKIIALSTCSQVGYMFASLGLLNFNGALFHLLTHAFFKALLFLCAGIIIYVSGGIQDIRKYGKYNIYLPQLFFCFFMANLSLLGFPYFSGFFSKDYLISFAYSLNTLSSILFLLSTCITISLTTFYSVRLLYYIFSIETNTTFINYAKLSEKYSFFFKFSLFGLLIGSIFFGYFCDSLLKTNTFFSFTTNTLNVVLNEHENRLLLNLPLYCIFVSIGFFFIMDDIILSKNVFNFFSNTMYVDYIYNKITSKIIQVASLLYKLFEKGLIEVLFVQGIFSFFFILLWLKKKAIEIINWFFVYKILTFLWILCVLHFFIFGFFGYLYFYLIINMLFFFFIL
jgi:NADH:ubiquinone oxidoreductase subunit 5 (subunit L)/multisubunit Na+/H+ antiporter MnhA subunit